MFVIINANLLFVIGIIIGFSISILLILLTFFFAPYSYSIEKQNPYECGFQPFEDSRNKFEVKYYLVAILYIIFDLELMFFLPWILNLYKFNLYAISVFLIFFVLLTLGFIYEWLKGALKWS